MHSYIGRDITDELRIQCHNWQQNHDYESDEALQNDARGDHGWRTKPWFLGVANKKLPQLPRARGGMSGQEQGHAAPRNTRATVMPLHVLFCKLCKHGMGIRLELLRDNAGAQTATLKKIKAVLVAAMGTWLMETSLFCHSREVTETSSHVLQIMLTLGETGITFMSGWLQTDSID